MWLEDDERIRKQDLTFSTPFVNTSGTLGFTPDHRVQPVLAHLGAFITNPISRRERKPAAMRACLPFTGGFLLHTGLPNPGISQVIRRYQRRWASAPLPVIVHLLIESPQTLAEMIRKLEGLENILAVELGLPPDCDPGLLVESMSAGAGELPLIPCLRPEQIPSLLETLTAQQPIAVHLVEPRGALPGLDGTIVMGRLDGPAIFPLMLQAARVLVQAGLRMIANGGLVARWQVDVLMESGVMAVGLGSALWQIEPETVFSPMNLKNSPFRGAKYV